MTPVDNEKVIMRRLISPEETRQLLEDIPQIETLPEQSARQQEISYSKALHSGDCRAWMSLVKTLTQRIESRKQKGKKERPRQTYVHNLLRRLGFTVYSTIDSPVKVAAVVEDCRRLVYGHE